MAAILYAAMIAFVPLLDPGYDAASQTVSELSAIGAPTRSVWVVTGALYGLSSALFGVGLWLAAGARRPLTVAAVLLIACAVFGVFWPPMHLRGEGFSLTDSLHIVWAIGWAGLTFAAMIFAAAGLRGRFAWFTVACMAVMFVAGMATSQGSANIPKNLPTPWVGVWERVSIGAYLLWLAVFAIILRRERGPSRR